MKQPKKPIKLKTPVVDTAAESTGVNTMPDSLKKKIWKDVHETSKNPLMLIKDKQTRDYIDKYQTGHSQYSVFGKEERKLIAQHHIKNGNPKIRPQSEGYAASTKSSHYNPLNNTMYIPTKNPAYEDLPDYNEELAHAQQKRDKGTMGMALDFAKGWMENPFFSREEQLKHYDAKGTLEHDAHTKRSPALHKSLEATYIKAVKNTNENARVLQNAKPKKYSNGTGGVKIKKPDTSTKQDATDTSNKPVYLPTKPKSSGEIRVEDARRKRNKAYVEAGLNAVSYLRAIPTPITQGIGWAAAASGSAIDINDGDHIEAALNLTPLKNVKLGSATAGAAVRGGKGLAAKVVAKNAGTVGNTINVVNDVKDAKEVTKYSNGTSGVKTYKSASKEERLEMDKEYDLARKSASKEFVSSVTGQKIAVTENQKNWKKGEFQVSRQLEDNKTRGNFDKDYLIVDDKNSTVHKVSKDHKLQKSYPAVTGANEGDGMPESSKSWLGRNPNNTFADYIEHLKLTQQKTTPAGEFEISGKRADPSIPVSRKDKIKQTIHDSGIQKVAQGVLATNPALAAIPGADLAYKDFNVKAKRKQTYGDSMLTLKDPKTGKGIGTAIHGTYYPDRVEALKSKDPSKRKLSATCVNLPNGDIVDLRTGMKVGAKVQMLPEDSTKTITKPKFDPTLVKKNAELLKRMNVKQHNPVAESTGVVAPRGVVMKRKTTK